MSGRIGKSANQRMTHYAPRLTFDAPRLTLHVSRLALLVVIVLAFALRVHRLAAYGLWYDEAVTAHVVAQGIAELTRWTADDIQPPLYYYVVAAWAGVAGRSEWALRFPSAAFGVLTAALAWALARRLFGSRLAGWAAAVLFALSAPHVYYAQEARMYAQLTFLGMLAGYALLRVMASPAEGRRWWLVFIGAAVAALYTHYFAAFLLFAYGVCVLAALGLRLSRGQIRPRALLAPAGAALAVGLLYLPWLPAMLTRYRVDRSYWQGALKLGEALRHVAISFTAGAPEMMLESDAVRLLLWFGLAFGVAVMALLWEGIRQRMETDKRIKALVYLCTCLLLPTLAILALASRTPKFNARYLLMVSPAYLLLLAGGLVMLLAHTPRFTFRVSRLTFDILRTALSAALLIFLLAASFVSLRNWFTDWSFAKAQWRELTAAVRARIAPDETVVLVSGHAWPAWDYYAADIPRIRLPDLDILDVDAVLGFDAGPALSQALAGKAGVWLVRWQAEAVDPVGFAPYFLDRLGAEQPQTRRFWHLDLRYWRLREGARLPAGPAHPDGANYAHKIALFGWDDPANRQLIVYWRALNRLEADYQVSLILMDAAGREVGRWDGRPAGYDYPTTRWRPEQALFGRYPLPLPAGAPAGDYYVSLAVYDAADPSGLDIRDVADNPAGKRVRLGPLRLGP
jgi:4-amino-4-deoxy-L-arabinose transferase-like glycosyltransferase